MADFYVSSIAQLKEFILQKRPFIALGSQTSTVLPFEQDLLPEDFLITSSLPKRIQLDEGSQTLAVSGPVTWKEANNYLNRFGLKLGSQPTEDSAQILSGVATSCTGEASFHYGPFRQHVREVGYINADGKEVILRDSESELVGELTFCEEYQLSSEKFANFKNAPFPFLRTNVDLMVGTEGQLGVITRVMFKVFPIVETSFVLIPCGNWREDTSHILALHQEYLEQRDNIYSFEFFDCHCIELIEEERLAASDYIALEVETSRLEAFALKESLALTKNQWNEIRVQIPRMISEKLAHEGLVKRGTDVQSSPRDLAKLLTLYQGLSELCESNYLFGHIGDCHLHFNLLPRAEEQEAIEKALDEFYSRLPNEIIASPFAEHGIGILKQAFIKNFWYDVQYKMFNSLKDRFDPDRIFFPSGYMGLKKK